MTKNGNRDQPFERLLRDSLRAGAPAGPAGGCLDADTLAAWADGTLSREERSAAEAHAAGCTDCQALMAAMVRTAPPAASVGSWWRTPAFAWLAPLTAAAAGIIIWTVMPDRDLRQQQERPGSALSDVPFAPVSPDRARTDLSTSNLESQSAKARDENGNAGADKKAESQIQARAGGAGTPVPRAKTLDSLRPAPAESAAPTTDLSTSDALAKDSASTEHTQGASAGTRDAFRMAASPPPPPLAAPTAAAREQMPMVRLSAGLSRQTSPFVIVSDDGNKRWRIPGGTATTIESSVDGGATWQSQSLGVTVTLTAGSSPSSSVCWLAGAGGVVLVSTDARTWRMAALPEAIDLRSIQATDGRVAQVVAVDGRGFRTADGGVRWVSSPGQ